MTEAQPIAYVCGDQQTAVVDIVFIHGITGDPSKTWVSGESNEYWPNWLNADFPQAAVFTVGFPAGLFEKWAKMEMNIHERAENILEHMASFGFGRRPIVFITHSLGGLLAKEILRASKESTDDGWKVIADNTAACIFLATPHTGSSLASALKFIAPRLSSTHINLLSNEGGYLTNLNHAYRDLATALSIKTISYYEKWATGKVSIVVTPQSADPGVGTIRPVAVDADHSSICKPNKRTDLVYVSICRHLKPVIDKCIENASLPASEIFDADDYAVASRSDRRDLMQKLIDAGREHEYQMANDAQNKFAQRYYKLGLFTDERRNSDLLLSSVEQRFVTHVYSEQICRKASDEQISSALQSHVIDAICTGLPGSPSARAVLNALYFLTEKCYIRWDPQ